MQWRILGLLLIAAVGIALIGVGAVLAFQTVMTYESYWSGQGVTIPVYRPAPTSALGFAMAPAGFIVLLIAASLFNLLASSIVRRSLRYAALLAMAGVPLVVVGVVLSVQVVHYVSARPGMSPGAMWWSSPSPISVVGLWVLLGGSVLSVASLWLFVFGSGAVRTAGRYFGARRL